MLEKSQFWQPLVLGVAAGQSIKATADVIGCSLDHAYQMSRLDSFKSAVRLVRSEAMERTVNRMVDASTRAVDTLVDCLDSEKPSDRIAAAKALLANMLPLDERFNLEERLAALELSTQGRAA